MRAFRFPIVTFVALGLLAAYILTSTREGEMNQVVTDRALSKTQTTLELGNTLVAPELSSEREALTSDEAGDVALGSAEQIQIAGKILANGELYGQCWVTILEPGSSQPQQLESQAGEFSFTHEGAVEVGERIGIVVEGMYGRIFDSSVALRRHIELDVTTSVEKQFIGKILVPGTPATARWYARVSVQKGGGQFGIAVSDETFGDYSDVEIHELGKGAVNVDGPVDVVLVGLDDPRTARGHRSFESLEDFRVELASAILIENVAATLSVPATITYLSLISAENSIAKYNGSHDGGEFSFFAPEGPYYLRAQTEAGHNRFGSVSLAASGFGEVNWVGDGSPERACIVHLVDESGEPLTGYSLVAETVAQGELLEKSHGVKTRLPTSVDGDGVFESLYPVEYNFYASGTSGPNSRTFLGTAGAGLDEVVTFALRPSDSVRVHVRVDPNEAAGSVTVLQPRFWLFDSRKSEWFSPVTWKSTREQGWMCCIPNGFKATDVAVRCGDFAGASHLGGGTKSATVKISRIREIRCSAKAKSLKDSTLLVRVFEQGFSAPLPWSIAKCDPGGLAAIYYWAGHKASVELVRDGTVLNHHDITVDEKMSLVEF